MARVHGTDTRIYVDQFNLSGRANTLDLEMAIPNSEVTAFEEVGEEFVVGKSRRGWSADVQSFVDFDADDLDEILDSILGDSDHHWGFYLDGAAAGSHGYEGIGAIDRRRFRAPGTGAQTLSAMVRGRGGVFLGEATKLNEATSVTGTGTLTAQQHRRATASGDRVIFVARIIAVDGTGSVTLRLEESADGDADPYAEVLTLGAMTAVGASRGAVVAGGVLGPHYRVNVTAFATFTSVSIRTAVALIPGG